MLLRNHQMLNYNTCTLNLFIFYSSKRIICLIYRKQEVFKIHQCEYGITFFVNNKHSFSLIIWLMQIISVSLQFIKCIVVPHKMTNWKNQSTECT